MIAHTGLGEVVKRFRADNALPYILLAMIIFAAIALALAATNPGLIAWLFAFAGVAAFGVSSGLLVFVVIKRPQMLRTERHEEIMRIIDRLESRDYDESNQAASSELIEDSNERPVSRKNAARSSGRSNQV